MRYWRCRRILRRSSHQFNDSRLQNRSLFRIHSIATITLNRADKRNAISYELIDDLIAALKQAANSSAQVVILTGAGKAFCSGMDLDNLKQLTGRTHEQKISGFRNYGVTVSDAL